MQQSHVGVDHDFDEFREADLGFPIELFFGLGRVADEEIDLGGAFVAGVVFDVIFPVEANAGEGVFDEFLNGVGLVRGDDIVVRLVLLEHEPHGFDIFGGVTPVALGVEVAEVEMLLLAELDGSDGAGDFASDKGLAPAWAFVVEEDAVRGVHAVAFAVVHGDPIGIHFCRAVGAAWPEGGCFGLRHGLHLAEHLTARGLVKSCIHTRLAHGFEDARGADASDITGVFWNIKADTHMALSAEMIDLIRLQIINELHQVHAIGQVAVVEKKFHAVDMRIRVNVVDAGRVECARAADDAVDFIAFIEKEVGKIAAVLTCDSGDECFFHKMEIGLKESTRVGAMVGGAD